MIPFLGSPPDSDRLPLEGVVARALLRSTVAPPWVAVEDEAGSWVTEAAAAPAAERARAVVAARSDRGLRAAVRLGLGGAIWLPPSTVDMTAALAAAATAAEPRAVDPALADLVLDQAFPLLAVTFAGVGFWRSELGEALAAELLDALARELGALPALLGWPALVVAGGNASGVAAAWERVTTGQLSWASALELEVIELAGAADAAVALAAAATTGTRCAPRPVVELGSGALVGWWAPGAPEAGAVRVSTWASRSPRPGSPSRLLLQWHAAGCERRGVPLWIPLVDGAMLPFAQSLPGRVWVDGPVVPDPTPAPGTSPSLPGGG